MAIASGTALKDLQPFLDGDGHVALPEGLPEGQRAGSDSAENTGQFFFRIYLGKL